MCSPCPTPACIPLASTKTHSERRAIWLPTANGEHLGQLTIVCRGVRRAAGDVTSYAVEEDTSAPFPTRVWLLAKQDEAADVYAVTLTPAGWSCSCPAAVAGKCAACRHVAALSALWDAGLLDPAMAEPVPVEEWDAAFGGGYGGEEW